MRNQVNCNGNMAATIDVSCSGTDSMAASRISPAAAAAVGNNNDDGHGGDDNNGHEMSWTLPRLFAMPPNRSWLLFKVLLDAIIVILLLVPMIILDGWVEPFHRGFFCDDDSIRYPFKTNTISTVVLALYSIGLPLLVICLNEYFIYRKYTLNYEVSARFFFTRYCWQIYLHLLPFMFACLTSQLITDISKYSIGRLRPHFIDVCRPRLTDGTIMDRFSLCKNPDVYVDDFVCSQKHDKLKDSRLSFMSGHSSFAAVSLLYLVIYIQFRFRWQQWGLWKPLMQYLLLCLVLYTGFSRISDYKHHWSDVLMGIIQGSLTALCCSFYVSDLYRAKNRCLKSMKVRCNYSTSISTNRVESGV